LTVNSMEQNQALNTHILQSYGATTVIFSYLSSLEVVSFQAINRWMYERGIRRV